MDASIIALRNWCDKAGIKLHERVLGNGSHHVWLYHIYRFDCEHRDFGFACMMLTAKLQHAFPWSFEGAA